LDRATPGVFPGSAGGGEVPVPSARLPRTLPSWIDPLLVALLAVLAFLPGFFGQFVTWDDDRNFLFNPAYRGLGWRELRWMFTTSHMGPYVPLTWITLGADYLAWGLRPRGYHLTSLAFHAATAALLMFVARRLLGAAVPMAPEAARRVGAAAAALAFAVHPLRVESVVWITERRDVVSGLFFMLAVLAYLRFAQDAVATPRRWYAASLGCFAAALLSKSIVVTLPVALLILDVYPLRRLGGRAGWTGPGARRVYLEKVPFLALSAAASAAAFLALAHLENMPSWDVFGPGPRAAVSVQALIFYLWKTLWPLGLSHLYELPARVEPLAPKALASAALVLLISIAVAAARRRAPALAAAWCFYAVSLLPVLGIFQNGPQMAADRYTYLACLGWALLAGGAVTWSATQCLTGPRPRAGGAVLAAAALALVLLVALSARQSLVWLDSFTLWRHAIAVDPTSPRAHAGLAVTLVRDGQAEEALAPLATALRLNPALPEALIGFAVALSALDRPNEALPYAREAVARKPSGAALHGVLGEVQRARGDLAAAVGSFREATRLAPDVAANHYDLAVTLAALGRTAEAAAALEEGRREASRVQRADPEADRAEARVYGRSDPARAIAAWQRYLGAMQAAPDPSLATIGRMVEGLAALEALRAPTPTSQAR